MNRPIHLRISVRWPHEGLPESFAILGMAPDGDEARLFARELTRLGHPHFPATIHDAHSPAGREGFAVQCSEAVAFGIGSSLSHESVWWVERGQLHRIECGDSFLRTLLGPWTDFAAPASFHFRGPVALLEHPATAFLCSTACPGDKILEAYDWATRQCDEGGTVISGFHTPVEKDVLAILARRGANILLVPARDLPKTTPKELQPAAEEGRLLILSPFDYGTQPRATKASCSQRNRFVLRYGESRYIPHVAADSTLAADLETPIL